MIAGQLPHLAGEMHPAIGQQDFGFADAAGIEDDLTRRGIARVVFIADAEVEDRQSSVQTPSPLQRTWMAWLSNGIALRKAAQVLGASASSKRA